MVIMGSIRTHAIGDTVTVGNHRRGPDSPIIGIARGKIIGTATKEEFIEFCNSENRIIGNIPNGALFYKVLVD